MIKIAIAGNPNSGKTTMFNTLSGKNERVGNWAGVTVQKKTARLRRKYNPWNEDIWLVDLPGAYGMSSYTNDETEATEFLKNEKIDIIINIVDASNLERSLFFTTQLIETGIPVVVALNKSDIISKRKTNIDIKKLSELLGAEVYFMQATTKTGLFTVVSGAVEQVLERGNYEKGQTEKRNHQGHSESSCNQRGRRHRNQHNR